MVLSAMDLTVRDVETKPTKSLPSVGRSDFRRGCSDWSQEGGSGRLWTAEKEKFN